MKAQSYRIPAVTGVPTKHSKLKFPVVITRDGVRSERLVEVQSRHMHGRVEWAVNKGKVYPPKGGNNVDHN